MPRIALVFPGQGSHFAGMGKTLYEQYPVVRNTFEEAEDVLGIPLRQLCFHGKISELSNPKYVQAAIITVSIAACRVYTQEIGIQPVVVAGHSFGEYAALVYAGAVSFSDALRLVHQRGLFAAEMIQKNTGSMTIVDEVPVTAVQQVCVELAEQGEHIYVTCFNSMMQCTIAGSPEALREAERLIRSKGGRTTPLIKSAPFHCQLAKGAADDFLPILQECAFESLQLPVLSNKNALPYDSSTQLAEQLYSHMIHPVQWLSILEWMEAHMVTTIIDMGPQNILRNLVVQTLPNVTTYAFAQANDRENLLRELRTHKEDQTNPINPYASFFANCLSVAVSTPNANPDTLRYRNEVLPAYQELQGFYENVSSHNIEGNMTDVMQAMQNLSQILLNKQIAQEELDRILQELLSKTSISIPSGATTFFKNRGR